MDEKILNSLLDYAREYMGAEIPFNNKWIIENFLIAERIKLSEQQSNCNLPQVMPTLPLVLDQLDNWEWVVKCDGEIVYNAGMFEYGKKDALYWIYINANCYKRQ